MALKMIAKLFEVSPNNRYPLMRDPKRNPRCYELTDREREEAVQRVDKVLRERTAEHNDEYEHRYYGA
jgi:hypothetical protein